jgi:hypothetical protein
MFSVPEGGEFGHQENGGEREVLILRAVGANNVSLEVQLCNLRFDGKKYRPYYYLLICMMLS